ncbi:MAG: uracil-DNA glycosylase [Candidatus Njordarchaeales archaeon]
MNKDLEDLAREIISCKKCPRLVSYIKEVAKKKRKMYQDWEYWGKPVPGYGDPNACLLIIGLAPGAHGANRTGRMFTGDSSGNWLMRALHEIGYANNPYSISKDDGLILKNVYITAPVRCAPPKNLPTRAEIRNCLPYLVRELKILRNIKVILTLGRIAFDSTLLALGDAFGLRFKPKPKFKHHAEYFLEQVGIWLYASYHPSRQNTQTKRLTWDMWISIFRIIRDICKTIT